MVFNVGFPTSESASLMAAHREYVLLAMPLSLKEVERMLAVRAFSSVITTADRVSCRFLDKEGHGNVITRSAPARTLLSSQQALSFQG